MSSEFCCDYCSTNPRNPCHSRSEAAVCSNLDRVSQRHYAPRGEQQLNTYIDELHAAVREYLAHPTGDRRATLLRTMEHERP